MWFLLVAVCMINVLIYLKLFYQNSLIPELSEESVGQPHTWPKLSIIIPACNEEDTIKTALTKVLNIDYPDYQVIVVNDRSTDQTKSILDKMTSFYPHLEVMHIETLPEGWLGKLHALHVGTQRADGQYLIYADADVHFHPTFFTKIVAYAEQQQLDYLSAIPLFHGQSWILRSLIFAFSCFFMAMTRLGSVNLDRPGAFGGVGVFQMIRASFFEKTPGWSWLKLEIGDDMAMAYMCHQYGSRARFIKASRLLALTWYPDTTSMIQGLEKNIFPVGMQFSIIRTFLVSVGLFALVFSPWLLIVMDHIYLGLSFIIVQILCNLTAPALGISWFERILSPYISMLLIIAIMQSMWKTLKQGGVIWRGTFYSVEDLKEGQRLWK